MIYVFVKEATDYLRTDMPLSVSDSFVRQEYPKIDLIEAKLLPVFFGYSTETDMILAKDMNKYFTFST